METFRKFSKTAFEQVDCGGLEGLGRTAHLVTPHLIRGLEMIGVAIANFSGEQNALRTDSKIEWISLNSMWAGQGAEKVRKFVVRAYQPRVLRPPRFLRKILGGKFHVAYVGLAEEGGAFAAPDLMLRKELKKIKKRANAVCVVARLKLDTVKRLLDEFKDIDVMIAAVVSNERPEQVRAEIEKLEERYKNLLLIEPLSRGQTLKIARICEFDGEVFVQREEIEMSEAEGESKQMLQFVSEAKKKIEDGTNAELKAIYEVPEEKFLTESAKLVEQRCGSCHKAAFKVWRGTKHSAAFSVLLRERKIFDQSCQLCHLSHFHAIGNKEFHLGGIDCMSCHVRAFEHMRDPLKVKPSRGQDCLACHDRLNSPQFRFDSYWAQIAH